MPSIGELGLLYETKRSVESFRYLICRVLWSVSKDHGRFYEAHPLSNKA